MPLTRPQPSRFSSTSSSRFDSTEERQLQQEGRTPTNLYAAASAQSLRQASRSRLDRDGSRSTPNLLRKNRPESAAVRSNVASTPEVPEPVVTATTAIHNAGTITQQSPSTPAAPFDLTTASNEPDHASGVRDGSDDTEEISTGSSKPVHRVAGLISPDTAGSSTPRPTASSSRLPTLRRPEMSQLGSTTSLDRIATPRSVRDLGSDYTRYYNPFATRNNSQQDLTTTLPLFNSSNVMVRGAVSSADLKRRLSDPFNDTKRLSNPFTAENTAPGTPIEQKKSKEKENDQEKEKEEVEAPPVATVTEVAGGAEGVAAVEMAQKPGTPAFIRNADPEKTPFYQYIDDRLGAPEYGFPLFADAKEDDDDMHMPAWDDDIKLKPKLKDRFSRENIASTLGLLFMLVGLLCVFVALPVISFTGTSLIPYSYDTPMDQMPGAWQPPVDPNAWDYVNSRVYPLFANLRQTLIDPDTPTSAMTRKDINGNTMNLVFSDEFNAQNRTFYPGDDPFWYGFDGWYGATQDLEWYDPDAANTGDGTLQLQLDAFPNHGLEYRSGMLHSWNQLCFKGGVFEVSASLPGPAGVHGLWPGMWTMGNLGRPGYLATTDGVWPYTYNECDVGITPNQSMNDGTSELPGQKLSSCTCSGQDHPSPGTGRGAPEIDIAEVSGDWGGMGLGVATQSFQVAPFDIWWYPDYEFMETPNYNVSFVNTYTGGPFQQAVSTTSMLNNEWYDGNQYQKFAFEYAPGSDEDAYIQWYIGDDEMMRFDARAIGPNGNIGQRQVSQEPMSMILNLGISHSWVDIEFQNLKFPTVLRIDHVRWYQKEGEEMVTCDPPGYETTQYIANHPAAYNNMNFTHWSDAGYDWPTNTLMNGCSA